MTMFDFLLFQKKDGGEKEMIPIVAGLIALILGFFGVSAAAIIFPQIGEILFAIALGLLAFLTRGVSIYEGERWKLNAGVFFAILAAIVMFLTFFGIPIAGLATVVYSTIGSVG